MEDHQPLLLDTSANVLSPSSPHLEHASSSTPPLFDQTNVRKPEYWQFARLIAPSFTPPEGKKQWTTHDAVGIWCLRCEKTLVFQKGSSQSIRYHMETKHYADLESYRMRTKVVASTRSGSLSKKRKIDPDRSDEVNSLAHIPTVSATTVNIQTNPTSPPQSLMTAPILPSPSVDWTWANNLGRKRSGFWGNAYWYDLHIERRMTGAKALIEEMTVALPPCDGKHVLDLCSGSGRASEALLTAYPTAYVIMVDASTERLQLARNRLASRNIRLADHQCVTAFIEPTSLVTISPVAVDVVIACLAIHILADIPAHYDRFRPRHVGSTMNACSSTPEEIFEHIFRGIFDLLKPGGHIVMGDVVDSVGVFTQLQVLSRIGFVDVDCSWREKDYFVAGARKPMEHEG